MCSCIYLSICSSQFVFHALFCHRCFPLSLQTCQCGGGLGCFLVFVPFPLFYLQLTSSFFSLPLFIFFIFSPLFSISMSIISKKEPKQFIIQITHTYKVYQEECYRTSCNVSLVKLNLLSFYLVVRHQF